MRRQKKTLKLIGWTLFLGYNEEPTITVKGEPHGDSVLQNCAETNGNEIMQITKPISEVIVAVAREKG